MIVVDDGSGDAIEKILEVLQNDKLFKSGILKSFDLKSCGFEFETEVTAKVLKNRYRLWEVPVSYAGCVYEEGKKLKKTV